MPPEPAPRDGGSRSVAASGAAVSAGSDATAVDPPRARRPSMAVGAGWALLLVGLIQPLAEVRADSLVTEAGDRLSGRVVSVGCDGIAFAWRDGRRLLVPLAAIARAETTAPRPIELAGGERLVGTLAVADGRLSLTSPLLGRIGLQPADLPPVGGDGSGRCPPPRLPAPPPGSSHALEAPEATADGRLAAASGRGAASAAAATPPAADPGSAADPAVSASATPAATVSTAGGEAAASAAGEAAPPAAREDAAAAVAPPPESEAEPLQFLRTEAVLLAPTKIEADLVLAYLRNNQAVQNDKIVAITPALRFGLIRNLEGFVQMPYSWGRREIDTFSGTEHQNVDGIGDVRFGLKYSVLPQSPATPNIVLALSSSAPTGQAPYLKPPADAPATELSRDLRDPFSIQLGSGHWSLTGGVTAIKSFDPLILFATASYTHFWPATYYGVDIEPGDLWDVNAGVGFAINDTGTLSTQLFAGYQEEWVFDGTHLAETSTSPISLRLAYTHILTPRDLIEPSVLFGLTDDTNDALIALAYSHSF